jgi:hypothetical protein
MRGVTSVVRSLMALGVVGLIASCADGPTAPERNTPAVSLAVGQAATGETIITDKDDYAPGETVVITGSGWQAGDSVDFVLTEDPSTHEPHTWTVGVDEAGGFLDDHFVVQDHDLGVTFTLTATSRATGATATAVFTDGSLSSGSIEVREGTCTTAQTSFSSGATVCAHLTLNISGGGSTAFWVQWIPPVGTRITHAKSTSGTGSGVSENDTQTASVVGTWSVVLCGSNPGTGTCAAPQTKDTKTFTVLSANSPPTVDAGDPYTVDEGTELTLSPTVTDPDAGDVLTYQWTIAYTPGGIDAGGSCSFNGTDTDKNAKVTCDDDSNGSTFTLTLEVKDGVGGHTVSDDADLTVNNVDPSITAVNVTPYVLGYMYPISGQPTIDATYTDPGSNDVLTCKFEVFDYLNQEVGTDKNCGVALGVTEAGVYDVKVTVADDDGGSDDETVQIIVYDPSAGFVTGGGWIYSAAGAYKDDLTLAGKGTFGFVSKYQKGANVPTGNTQFVFHADGANGNALDFHSTSYDWLVVNGVGTRAQYKGSGNIAGRSDSFTFMLTAIDNSPDQFRIQIFRPDGSTLYDNYVSGPATEQPLGGGSIVIHTSKK